MSKGSTTDDDSDRETIEVRNITSDMVELMIYPDKGDDHHDEAFQHPRAKHGHGIFIFTNASNINRDPRPHTNMGKAQARKWQTSW